jgi:hypothetical protein
VNPLTPVPLRASGDRAGLLKAFGPPVVIGAESHVLTDEMLDTLIPMALYEDIPKVLLERYGGLVDGITLNPPAHTRHDDQISAAIRALQAAVPQSAADRG